MAMSRSFGITVFTQRSPIQISPALGSSRPATMRMVVVLPQPDGPSRTRNSPSATVSDCLATAVKLAHRFSTFLSTTWAI